MLPTGRFLSLTPIDCKASSMPGTVDWSAPRRASSCFKSTAFDHSSIKNFSSRRIIRVRT